MTTINELDSGSPPMEIYVHQGGETIGPLNSDEFKDGVESGAFAMSDMAIHPDHGEEWIPIGDILQKEKTSTPKKLSTGSAIACKTCSGGILIHRKVFRFNGNLDAFGRSLFSVAFFSVIFFCVLAFVTASTPESALIDRDSGTSWIHGAGVQINGITLEAFPSLIKGVSDYEDLVRALALVYGVAAIFSAALGILGWLLSRRKDMLVCDRCGSSSLFVSKSQIY